jgi:hypothetical protein
MPFSPSDPPAKIRKLSEKKQRQWVYVLNRSLKDGDDEGTAHAKAWGVVKKSSCDCDGGCGGNCGCSGQIIGPMENEGSLADAVRNQDILRGNNYAGSTRHMGRELLAIAKSLVAEVTLSQGDDYRRVVSDAIRSGEVLTFLYRKKDGSTRQVRIQPQALLGDKGVRGIDMDDPAKTPKVFMFEGIDGGERGGGGEVKSPQSLTYDDVERLYKRGKEIFVNTEDRMSVSGTRCFLESEWVQVPEFNFAFKLRSGIIDIPKWRLIVRMTRYRQDGSTVESKQQTSSHFIKDGNKIKVGYVLGSDSYLIHASGSDYDISDRGGADRVQRYLESYYDHILQSLKIKMVDGEQDLKRLIVELHADREIAEVFLDELEKDIGSRQYEEGKKSSFDFWRVMHMWGNIKKAGLLRAMVPMEILKVLKHFDLRPLEKGLMSGRPFVEQFTENESHSSTGSGYSMGYQLGVDKDIQGHSTSDVSGLSSVNALKRITFNGRKFVLVKYYDRSDSMGS